LYTLAFIVGFAAVATKLKLFSNDFYRSFLYAAGMVLYLIAIGDVFSIQHTLLQVKTSTLHFAAHWISDLLVLVVAWNFISLIRSGHFPKSVSHTALTWLVCIFLVLFISFEGSLISNALFYSGDTTLPDIRRVYIKAGLPILWGLSSFALMWLGMKYKDRSLRIISLVLFAITLLKLFLFDIRNIPVAGKIAAFFSLGVILLIVSFMYQRLKKIIIEDEKKPGTV